MISKIIFNLRIIVRVLIGHYFQLYKFVFKSKKNEEKLLFSSNTGLVIEGFPRVGNTFFVLAFERFCKDQVNIAHHVHLTCQIKEALKNNVPIIVLIRNPFDSVLSLKIREPKIFINIALAWYFFYYNYVLRNKKRVHIKCFDKFTNDFSTLEVAGFNFEKSKKLREEDVFKQIANINKKDSNKTTKDRLSISSPNNEKEKIKQDLKLKIQKGTFLERKCYQLYKDLIY